MKQVKSSELSKNLTYYLDDPEPIEITKYGKVIKMLVEPDRELRTVAPARAVVPKPMSHPELQDRKRYPSLAEKIAEDRRKLELLRKVNKG